MTSTTQATKHPPTEWIPSEDVAARLRQAMVYVVDDSEQVRQSIRLVAHSIQLNAETYHSAQAFLEKFRPDIPSCLVLDVYLPGMNGVELLETMQARNQLIPTIVITAYGEVSNAVRAMKAGAVDYIQKPFDRQQLVDLILRALIGPGECRLSTPESLEAAERMSKLSDREREIMHLFFGGENTKRIAAQLGISPKTVDYHRWNILKKMNAANMVELAHYVAMHLNT